MLRRRHVLIDLLLSDPAMFKASGRLQMELLEEYFEGLPLDTLRALLKSTDISVLQCAAFIASELGSRASDLVDVLAPLLQLGERQISCDVMEALLVCCQGEHVREIYHVLKMFESTDDIVRWQAMQLISRASDSQLQAALQHFEAVEPNGEYSRLLRIVVGSAATRDLVTEMLYAASPLTRRFGTIAARRMSSHEPGLMHEVSRSSDPDLVRFCRTEASE